MKNFIKNLYFSNYFWGGLLAFVGLFMVSYLLPLLFGFVKIGFMGFVVVAVLDMVVLFRANGIFARRDIADRLSNGDPNPAVIYVQNLYGFKTFIEIIDELPIQFQRRDILFELRLSPNQTQPLSYDIRPTKRGEYNFGTLNVYAMSWLRLAKRRYRFDQNKDVTVYPSYMQMKQYEIMAFSNRLTDVGVKKIRRIGHSTEFEQIRQYVQGDDFRTINWKASARRNDLMVNAFQDERSQSIYCLIDKGRVMRSPFEELTLLDYAINATLVLSNIALLKHDKAGVVTFSDVMGQSLLAEKKAGQLQKILDLLYKQKTRYLETDYETLYAHLKLKIRQRSLLLLFTNFETINGLMRQMPYLRRIAREHLLIVVFFENTETNHLLNSRAETTEDIYKKTIAERFHYEKKRIVKELEKYGIQSILTAPKDLNANTVNKYLELKARGMV